ncbi:MAG: TetR family transcriptional regulator [Acidimicrobiales bacterium]|nr:MAG: TetR family transcriptional regulator [Acidimicrobiales bacterium]
MARTKEFDPGVALDAAMELFWRRGYEATSTADLVAHLGVARASLYATFGGKHDLYLKAFDRYLQSRDPNIVELLSRPGPAVPLVRKLVRLYAQESTTELGKRGCFVVSAAAERLPEDESVARRVQSSWDTVEVALTSVLLRARAQGELSEDAEPRALARFFLVFLQGMRVVGMGAANPDRLNDAVRQALRVLE